MRFAALLTVLLGSLLLAAQESTTQIEKTTAPRTLPSSAKDMYTAYCAACHGVEGKGDGPAAPALKQPPTDLTMLAKNNGGKFPSMLVQNTLTHVSDTAHGSAGLPIWGPILFSVSGRDASATKLRVANLTHYLETMQAK